MFFIVEQFFPAFMMEANATLPSPALKLKLVLVIEGIHDRASQFFRIYWP